MAPFADYDSFEACTRANSDKDDPEAYCAAIKREIEGEDSLSDVELQALEESNCGEGHVEINGECVPIEDVDDAPPSLLSSPRILTGRTLAGPIKREELDGGGVLYKNMALLDRGVWTDAGSGEPAEYDPAELEIANDNTLNIAHDSENDVSEIGHIKADSWTVEDGTGYADIVLSMDSPASEFADENLQSALESNGEVGFGGWSIELPPNSYELKRKENGIPKVVDGTVSGGGLVMNPASKTTSIEHQTRNRQVAMARALSSGEGSKVFLRQDDSMSPDKRERIMSEVLSRELQVDEIQDDAQAIADELDVPVGDVMEVLDPLLDMDEEGEEDENGEDEDVEAEDDEDDETDEEEEEQEMEDAEAMQEQIDDLRAEIEDLKESMMSGEELAAADEVAQLREEKKELAEKIDSLKDELEDRDKRLEALEDEPKKTKTLADTDGEDFEPNWDTTPSSPSRW